MNVWNLSTNSFYFTGVFTDGTTQSLVLAADSGCQVGGAIVSGSSYIESFDTNYVLVNSDTSGAVVHALPAPTSLFLEGFFAVAPLTAVIVAIIFIRRSLGGGSRGYSISD
jgi:hypothetical protein